MKSNKNKMNLSKVAFVIFTVAMILLFAWFVKLTAWSQTDIAQGEMERYYREKEQTLLSEAKEYLNQNGYKNSGVTLTRCVDEVGQREYTITIHHKRIDNMDDKERTTLRNELAKLNFEDEGCEFSYEFLLLNQ